MITIDVVIIQLRIYDILIKKKNGSFVLENS